MSERGSVKVCAVMVAYFPDVDFDKRYRPVLDQVDALVIVDNTPRDRRTTRVQIPILPNKRALLIENPTNLGLAHALNQGLEQALSWNCHWLLTLDQDTNCFPQMVVTLLRIAHHLHPCQAVIGSNYYDRRNQRISITPASDGLYLEQTTVITSGTLVECRFAKAIGGFRDDYFIDQLDHEFCLRAQSHNAIVVASREPLMAHSVGESGGLRLPLLGHLPKHSPSRQYYIVRNSLVTILRYWRRAPIWCITRFARLCLGVTLAAFEDDSRQRLRASALGIADAFGNKLGQLHPDRLTIKASDKSEY